MRQSDISRIERGKVGLPRRARLARIAAALELPLGELLARSGWVGADTVFAAERRPRRPVDPPAMLDRLPVPVATTAPPAPARTVRSQDLQAASDHAHELEAWSADLLRRSAATMETASRPQPRSVEDPALPLPDAPDEGEDATADEGGIARQPA